MPGANLTRSEAAERAATVRSSGVTVELDLTAPPSAGDTFRSVSTVTFSAEPGASTFLDVIAETVHEVVLNGRSLDVAEVVSEARVALPDLAADNTVRVVADCTYSRSGEGLHRFVDPVDGEVYLYSQFEVADARRMYACFDQPDLKAAFTLAVTAPGHWQVVSNSPTPRPQPAGEGTASWSFAATAGISSYITALVAGPYHVVRDARGDLPMAVYCRRSLAEHLDADEVLDITKRGFDFFESVFDLPYPFEKYDQLFVPEFNAGAMENAGCVTFLEDYVFRSKVTDASYERRALTVLHELAHMWFGDLVTMRWWDDLWLNESFAEYISTLCQSEVTRWTGAWTTFANVEKTWAYRQDQLPSTHPIAADIRDLEDVEVNFDGITYAKGASVLKQLVAWVGRDQFMAGLRAYFRAHAWGNTELSDLLDALEQSSGRDLRAWSREWLQTAGVNTLRPAFELDEQGRYTRLELVQEAAAPHPTLRSHRVAVGLYDLTDGGLVRRAGDGGRIELDVVGASTPVPQLVGASQPDLLLVNDDDLAYTKIRLDDRSLGTLLGSIGRFRDSLPRTLCWAAAWDMTRDAEMAGRDFLTLVLSGIEAESDIAVVQFLLRSARSTVESYLDPEHRAAARARLADGLAGLVERAEPGSDHQLAFVRAFTGIAGTDEHLDLVQGLLDGGRVLDGLAVDADLRWTLLVRLAATGRAGSAEIDAELSRDGTAAGHRHAATARAARPTAEAKEQAWADLVDRGDLPNSIASATIGGFVQYDQRELLRPYVGRYFDVVVDLWRTRSNEMAQQVVVGCYPALFVEPATVEATDAWLAAADPVPALRRLVLEGRDGVERALRAQERDRRAG